MVEIISLASIDLNYIIHVSQQHLCHVLCTHSRTEWPVGTVRHQILCTDGNCAVESQSLYINISSFALCIYFRHHHHALFKHRTLGGGGGEPSDLALDTRENQ